jgi:serum/glucocorticoid-regulated kinase 2
MEGIVNVASFSLLSVIGKGNYAKVLLVKKKDNDKLYAMKALKKKYIEHKR